MTEDSTVVAEDTVTPVNSVPDQADTASPDTPEDTKPVPEAKTFTQEQVDAIVAKRVAKESRRSERELRNRVEQMEQRINPQAYMQEDRVLDKSQYASDDDYIEAKSEQKAAEKMRFRDEERAKAAVAAKKEKVLSEAEKSGDFDREEFFENVKVLTTLAAEAIIESPMAEKILIHLNTNPDEADRIAQLPLARQAAEIGKLEILLSAAKAQKTAAPTPITPLSGSGKVSKDPSQMTDTEFSKWRKAQIAQRGN